MCGKQARTTRRGRPQLLNARGIAGVSVFHRADCSDSREMLGNLETVNSWSSEYVGTREASSNEADCKQLDAEVLDAWIWKKE